jgi:hypothetical protein
VWPAVVECPGAVKADDLLTDLRKAHSVAAPGIERVRGGRRMSEFSFKNLSVKLFPEVALAEDAALVCECCSFQMGCGDCTCTDTPTVPECGVCTDTPTGPECGACTETETCGACSVGETGTPCEGPTDDCFPCTDFDPSIRCSDETCLEDTGCHHSVPIVVRPPGVEDAPVGGPRPPDVIMGELRLLRAELRQAMGLPPEREEEAEAPGKPRTVEELDRLRAALVGAVAELDEHRGRIEGERQPE